MRIKPLWWLIATWLGSGLAPKASGTFGSLAALPFAFAIQYYVGNEALLIAAILVFFIGWWASAKYMQHYPEKHDPKQIVVDEVAGMWLTLSLIPFTWQFYIIGFALFRFFDAVKPWPISVADHKIKGGFGVMFDDILAAVFAIIFSALFLLLPIYGTH